VSELQQVPPADTQDDGAEAPARTGAREALRRRLPREFGALMA